MAESTAPQSTYWWEAQFDISVTGSYQYQRDHTCFNGQYTFLVKLNALMELDPDNDFMVYGGDHKITVIKWAETPCNPKNNTPSIDLTEKIAPDIRLNYALNENNVLKFDFEIFIDERKVPTEYKALSRIILPRSALNKDMHPTSHYNKYVVKKGSNQISMNEKTVLESTKTSKSFSWQWKRKKGSVLNSHEINIDLTILRQEKTKK